jgi:hypothetical protein
MSPRNYAVVCFVSILFSSSGAFGQGLKLKSRLAEQIEGEWEPASSVLKALAVPSPNFNVKFRNDNKAEEHFVKLNEKLPKRAKEALAKVFATTQCYGWMSVIRENAAANEHPFALAEMGGNFLVFYLREKNGDPYGDVEEYIISGAKGARRANDLLFLAHTNGPALAFQRKQ